jgi:Methyltransferase domain
LPFSQVEWLARIPSSYDCLSQWQLRRVRHPQPTMAVDRVRRVVTSAAANSFAVGTESLNFLDGRVGQLRPEAILEFGSGVSTVVLAARMVDLHGRDRPRVFSVDESKRYLDETQRMLNSAGLSGCARLAHREIREQVIHGRSTACYDIDESFLDSFLELVPDLLFVDGPSGGGSVRFGTLPLVLGRTAIPCTFFLDDALRESEIHVASLWRDLTGIELAAVHVVGHGLLEGRIVA